MIKFIKMLLILSTAVSIEIIWFKWLSGTPLALWNILYITAIGILYIIMTMVLLDDDSAALHHTVTMMLKGSKVLRRHTKKMNTKQFMEYMRGRYLVRTMAEVVSNIGEIKSYCERNGVPEDNAEVKYMLDLLTNLLADMRASNDKNN
jgi:hypothetical protein